jgi:CRP/FNR family transcriptional regulator, cyclic AMP receptor protein
VTDKAQDGLFDRFGRTFAAGEVVFSEGETGTEMFVIQSGRVQLSRRVRGREMHLLTLAAGEFFGEMAIVNNKPRSATATVIDEARVLALDARTFEAMVRGNAEIALRLIKKLAGRLDHANMQVERLLLQDLNHRMVHHLRHLAAAAGQPDGAGVLVETNLDELAMHLDAEPHDIQTCLERLEQAKLVRLADNGLEIAAVGKLDQFLSFLDMKERMGVK